MTDLPGHAPGRSIPGRFAEMAARFPDRLAVAGPDRDVTYPELKRAAGRVARAVDASGAARGEPVAVLLPPGAAAIAAILGVLDTGRPYVPLDPSLPRARLAWILDDSGAQVVLADAAGSAGIGKGRRVLAVEEILARRWDEPGPGNADGAENAGGAGPGPESPAWILYTSGSTGRPKGVIQTHRNVLHYARRYREGLEIRPADRLSLVFSLDANIASHNVFAALLAGASLHPFDVAGEGVAGLADWLVEREVTVCWLVPTVFRRLADGPLPAAGFPRLRLVQLGGEPVYRRDVLAWRERLGAPGVLVNRLGSSETGTIRWHFVDRATRVEGTEVPVGHPVPDQEILLLGPAGEVVGGDGRSGGPVTGEIAVRSRFLSPGYWKSPEQTAAAFLPDPGGGDRRVYRTGDVGRMSRDGCLVCLGRRDAQVKIRGHRVEPGEVERALLELEAVGEAFVKVGRARRDEARLVAYVVPAPDAQASPLRADVLGTALRRSLPDYMVPAAFVRLEALPQTPNGKVDRSALPDPGRTRPELRTPWAAPRNRTEERVLEIWSEALEIEGLGVHDQFLDVGGDSLLAGRVVARVAESFELDLPVRTLFEAPSVADMARILDEARTGVPRD